MRFAVLLEHVVRNFRQLGDLAASIRPRKLYPQQSCPRRPEVLHVTAGNKNYLLNVLSLEYLEASVLCGFYLLSNEVAKVVLPGTTLKLLIRLFS